MGNKVDLFNDIYTRLNTAIGAGKPLASVNRVQVGSREEARKMNDLPIINMNLSSGTEIAISQPNCKRDEMTIDIILIVSKPDATTENNLFNKVAGTGALYLFEDLLNVVDKTVTDVIDLTFSATAGQIPEYSYDVEYLEGMIEFSFELIVQTADFTVGSR